MPLIASEKETDYEPIEAGVHHAICCWVIDLGHQFNEKWGNDQHKVLIAWELPRDRIEIEENGVSVDKPKVISRIFTLSLGTKSHLRPFLESWRGKAFGFEELMGFDISKLIGVNCQLNIVHAHVNEKTYANVATAMPLLRGTVAFPPENDTIMFSIEDHGLAIPDNVPDWIKTKFMKCREYNETGQMNDEQRYPSANDDEPPLPDDDIPF
jgi:hypothetical protein